MRYVFVLAILSATLTSCSGVEKINRNSIKVTEIAQSSKDRFLIIADESRVTGYLDKELIQSVLIGNISDSCPE